MDNKSFLQEVHHYIDERYSVFNKMQEITWNTLLEFDRVCKHNDVNYYLAYGTLLGAVRDKGQIPWDYDIDLIVPIGDRDKLISSLDKDLDKSYYYAYKNNTPNYPACCLRVCEKEYDCNAIHVDVFFAIGCPNSGHKQLDFFSNYKKIIAKRSWLFFPEYHKINNDNTLFSILTKVYKKINKIFYSEKMISRIEEQRINQYNYKESDFCMIFCDVYYRVYPKRIFEKKKMIKVKGSEFPIPYYYDEFLEITYKDYQSYLPIKNRFDEFYTHLSIIEERLNPLCLKNE